MNIVQHLLVVPIRLYRWLVSPVLVTLFSPRGLCRFEPTCSAYAIESVARHGAWNGSLLAARRLCRCHPWGGCGHDPVPPKSEIPDSRFKIEPLPVGANSRC